MSLRALLLCLAALLAVAAPTPATESVDVELRRVGPRLIAHCKDKGCANVGVLKFLVTRDGKRRSDNVGTLNMLLARRLEAALVVGNDAKIPVGIINNASAVAQRIKGANHLQKDARRKLFDADYPLAWSGKEVKPDGFFAGLAAVSANLKTLTIDVMFFDKKENTLASVEQVTAVIQPEYLVEMSESFNTRGLFDPTEDAAQVVEGKKVHPALDPKAPVRLEVFYDGHKVPFRVENGQVFLTEPREGQEVTMVLKRDNAKERYGVVLKVNGESTIFKQRSPDLQCLRWILEPGTEPREIRGYQKDGNTLEKFRVLSVRESQEKEINYGADVGTITLTVFREQKGKRPALPQGEDAVVANATLDVKNDKGEVVKPKNFDALMASLLDDANRGIIAEGKTEAGIINRVRFQPDPKPIMSFTVFYRQAR